MWSVEAAIRAKEGPWHWLSVTIYKCSNTWSLTVKVDQGSGTRECRSDINATTYWLSDFGKVVWPLKPVSPNINVYNNTSHLTGFLWEKWYYVSKSQHTAWYILRVQKESSVIIIGINVLISSLKLRLFQKVILSSLYV